MIVKEKLWFCGKFIVDVLKNSSGEETIIETYTHTQTPLFYFIFFFFKKQFTFLPYTATQQIIIINGGAQHFFLVFC